MPGQDNSVCAAATSEAVMFPEIRHDATADRAGDQRSSEKDREINQSPGQGDTEPRQDSKSSRSGEGWVTRHDSDLF